MSKAKGPMWSVVDSNATAFKPGTNEIMPRAHDLAPGVRFELFADKSVEMEERWARLFLKDPSFIVRDANGNVVRGLDEQQIQRVAPQERLPPNRVIADLDELTDVALRTRVAVHPRALDLPREPDRALMIDFLTGIFEESYAPPRGNDDRLALDDGSGGTTSDPALDAARVLSGE